MKRRNSPESVIELDETDEAIVLALQADGRQPYGRIAVSVGLSEFAVRQRVQRLVEEGVMRIVAITDPETLGRRLRATLGVRVVGDIHPVTAVFDALDEVDFVVSTAGTYDLLAEVQCRDEAHFNGILNEIRKQSGVQRIDTMVYLEFHKRTYAWPPGANQLPAGLTPDGTSPA